MAITAPELLTNNHDLSAFQCGREDLDNWLLKKALKSQTGNNTRVYVVTDQSCNQVVGYYAVAMGSVQRERAIGSLKCP